MFFERSLDFFRKIFVPPAVDQDKLVSAIAHDEGVFRTGGLQETCGILQRLVADLVSVFVVDGLHIVQVDKEDLHGPFGCQEVIIVLLAKAGKPETIVQAGQRVVNIKVVQRVIQGLEQALFADVFKSGLQEVEDALVQVQLCGGADAVQRDVADGIGAVMQRIEDQEMLPLHDALRQQVSSRE